MNVHGEPCCRTTCNSRRLAKISIPGRSRRGFCEGDPLARERGASSPVHSASPWACGSERDNFNSSVSYLWAPFSSPSSSSPITCPRERSPTGEVSLLSISSSLSRLRHRGVDRDRQLLKEKIEKANIPPPPLPKPQLVEDISDVVQKRDFIKEVRGLLDKLLADDALCMDGLPAICLGLE